VTDQYLHYLEMMRMLNLNFAGEFLAMAATLLYIKSKMLLPPEEVPEEDEEPVEDPRAELVRQLVEYKQFKDVAEDMQEIETRHLSTFRREDTAAAHLEEAERPLSDVTMFDLLSAFSEALERAARAEGVHEVEEEEVTIAEQMEVILSRLRGKRELLFHLLFPEGAGRMVLIVTFLALLELIRLKKLVAVQERPFAEIKILRR
jgi:segregation and condensation protein A